MKVVAFLVAVLAVASAFTPSQVSPRTSVAVNSLFDDVSLPYCYSSSSLLGFSLDSPSTHTKKEAT